MVRFLKTRIVRGEPLLASDINDLTFFPKGTILTFSSTAWSATSAEFKTIWKICNAANHSVDAFIPDLTNKFLRGAESSGAIGGADNQSVPITTANLPAHSHGAGTLAISKLSTSGLSVSDQSIRGLKIDSDGKHEHTLSGGVVSDGAHEHTLTGGTDSEAAHTHGVSITSGGMSANATGTTVFDGSDGDSALHSAAGNMTRTLGGVINTSEGNRDAYESTLTLNVSHTHLVSGTSGTGSSHSHGFSATTKASSDGAHTHDFSSTSKATESGSHSHTVNSGDAEIYGGKISGSITGGTFSGSTASVGSSTALTIDTLPSYYAVIYIIKVV
jgi:hypothetical protein